jgi:chromate transporter
LPCFWFVFVGAPHVERLGEQPRFGAALTAITAAVVGVILNLGVNFTRNALWPDTGGLDVFVALLAGAAFVAMQRFKVGIIPVIAACAFIGLLKNLAGL